MDDVPPDNDVGAIPVDIAPPSLEPGQVQVNRRHEQGLVLKEERFPEPLVFHEQMELRQLVGFPGSLEPAQRTASAPALPASRVRVNPEVQLHSHQSYDLRIAD